MFDMLTTLAIGAVAGGVAALSLALFFKAMMQGATAWQVEDHHVIPERYSEWDNGAKVMKNKWRCLDCGRLRNRRTAFRDTACDIERVRIN
jgi:hypothetical protein